MPDTTIRIDREQRDALYEIVRNHLGSVSDLWDALEQDKDFATAERLGLEFGEDFRLLADIGWGEDERRESFGLTMPIHDLMELLQRLRGEAAVVLAGWTEENREEAEKKEQYRRCRDACERTLADVSRIAGGGV